MKHNDHYTKHFFRLLAVGLIAGAFLWGLSITDAKADNGNSLEIVCTPDMSKEQVLPCLDELSHVINGMTQETKELLEELRKPKIINNETDSG